MALYRQNSFSGGMLSRSLEGRTDYAKRVNGARNIVNFFVTPQGTLRKRSGIRPVLGVSTAGRGARLIPFITENSAQFLVVVSGGDAEGQPGRIQVLGENDVVELGGFSPPWGPEDIHPDPTDASKPGIKWSQGTDQLLITHPDHPPALLTLTPVAGQEGRDSRRWELQSAAAVRGQESPTAATAVVFPRAVRGG